MTQLIPLAEALAAITLAESNLSRADQDIMDEDMNEDADEYRFDLTYELFYEATTSENWRPGYAFTHADNIIEDTVKLAAKNRTREGRRDHYKHWAVSTRFKLESCHLFGLIDGTMCKPPIADVQRSEEYRETVQYTRAIIWCRIHEDSHWLIRLDADPMED